MTSWYPLHDSIHLEGVQSTEQTSKRIDHEDAARQVKTAQAILERLHDQPGVVLADEVGMGKTFVALAVATSVTLADPKRRPAVVMVPSSLSKKWPSDFSYFAKRCLDSETAKDVRCRSASTGVEFLKLLDDPLERRATIIFLTHGAMYRGLTDGWVKLAVIQRTLFRRRDTQPIRRALALCAGELLRLKRVDHAGPDFWNELLDTRPNDWLTVLRKFKVDPEADGNSATDDDPVPEAVVNVLDQLSAEDTQKVYEKLKDLPQRQTPSWKRRVSEARGALMDQLKPVWTSCLSQLSYKLPLLVMDEAHHLKNADTNLAKLFHTAESAKDAEEVSLARVFKRMLFLTATPFQLGHHELCSVLERFDGIAWKSGGAPATSREDFKSHLAKLRELLDAAQHATQHLEAKWGKLRSHDLVVNGKATPNAETWWESVSNGGSQSSVAAGIVQTFNVAKQVMKAAEGVLRPLVVRHLRERTLKGMFKGNPRRERLPGAAILNDVATAHEQGIEVNGPALVPFLLAARATTCRPDDRPVFAEGLASSYEAFRKTRHPDSETKHTGTGVGTDDDDSNSTSDGTSSSESPPGNPKVASAADPADWYLDQLENLLPSDDVAKSGSHPKIAATVQRVLDAWKDGEKVLVFCHFLATGRVLRQVISDRLTQQIEFDAAAKIGCPQTEVRERLDSLSQVFRRSHGEDSRTRQAVNQEVAKLLESFPMLSERRDEEPHDLHEELQRVCRRFIRTPSFLVRYFPLDSDRLDAAAVKQAFDIGGSSGLSLRDLLMGFFRFLAHDCVSHERWEYVDAIRHVQTGNIHGDEVQTSSSTTEVAASTTERLLPNVRLVNGPTRSEIRQRLMLTFNSPFFPEVLVASSVMAEGVDLHRFCRYVIHHDLSWNPSTLEQRTGRVDRIGGKVEKCGQPIRVYLPYLGETQDEKQYRVVMDRERWFSVVMGENFRTDARHTDHIAERVPFPESLARQLAFRLEADESP